MKCSIPAFKESKINIDCAVCSWRQWMLGRDFSLTADLTYCLNTRKLSVCRNNTFLFPPLLILLFSSRCVTHIQEQQSPSWFEKHCLVLSSAYSRKEGCLLSWVAGLFNTHMHTHLCLLMDTRCMCTHTLKPAFLMLLARMDVQISQDVKISCAFENWHEVLLIALCMCECFLLLSFFYSLNCVWFRHSLLRYWISSPCAIWSEPSAPSMQLNWKWTCCQGWGRFIQDF